jgi:hypothetical protein
MLRPSQVALRKLKVILMQLAPFSVALRARWIGCAARPVSRLPRYGSVVTAPRADTVFKCHGQECPCSLG